LQSPKPAAQVSVHLPNVQAPVPCGPFLQTTPHAPQLVLAFRSASHPFAGSASQSPKPGVQRTGAHAPFTQAAVAFGSAHGVHAGAAHPKSGSTIDTQRSPHFFMPVEQPPVGGGAGEVPAASPFVFPETCDAEESSSCDAEPRSRVLASLAPARLGVALWSNWPGSLSISALQPAAAAAIAIASSSFRRRIIDDSSFNSRTSSCDFEELCFRAVDVD